MNGQRWCSWRATIRRTQFGHTYVDIPSPDCITDDPDDDPLPTWQDCYVMMPKGRIRKDAEKAEVQGAWAAWDSDKTGGQSYYMATIIQ